MGTIGTQDGEAGTDGAKVKSLLVEALTAHKAGDLERAVAGYRQVLELVPDQVEAMTNLAVALRSRGEVDDAVGLLERATAIAPEHPDANYNLGNAYRALGRNADAADRFGIAIAANPDNRGAYLNRALALRDAERHDEAVACLRAGLERIGEDAAIYRNLGAVLWSADRIEASAAAYRRSVALAPDETGARHELAQMLFRLADYKGAIAQSRAVLEIDPSFAEAHAVIGKCFTSLGRFDEALAAYDAAFALEPDNVMAELGRALTLLQRGELEAGFRAYECRWRLPDVTVPSFAHPKWNGEDLGGRRILLAVEQGLGDVIQAVRYAPMVAARGGQVIVQCQPALARLMAAARGVDAVAPTDAPLPDFDLYVPLFDLPTIFGTGLDTIPAEVPYIDLESGEASTPTGPLRVGLVWAGNPSHQNDRNRSCGLAAMLDLLALPGVRYSGLQVGPRAADIGALGCGALVEDLSGRIDDFLDTARELLRLDLLISVDTATAHLAGALGRPVWLLLPRACDWRWLSGRSDSPWYPSMRIFRQDAQGDWPGVMARVGADLAAYRR